MAEERLALVLAPLPASQTLLRRSRPAQLPVSGGSEEGEQDCDAAGVEGGALIHYGTRDAKSSLVQNRYCSPAENVNWS